MKLHSLTCSFCVGCLLIITAAGRLWAADKAWNGADGEWSDPNKWIPTGVPANDDNITITNGNISLASYVAVEGTLTWYGGSLRGTGLQIEPSGILNLAGSSDKLFIHSVLINAGTVNWQGGRLLAYANNYGQRVYITNQAGALFHVLTDASTTRANSWSPYGVPEFLFHNAGTLLKETATGTNQFDGLQVVSTGLIDLQTGPINFNGGLINSGEIRLGNGLNLNLGGLDHSGAIHLGEGLTVLVTADSVFRPGSTLDGPAGNLVLYQGGKITFEPGFTFSPTLTNRVVGSCQFIGAINLPHFELISGAISGGFTNAGTLTWTNGNLSGATFVNATNGVLEVLGSADKLFIHSVLINAGTVNWQGGRLMAYANNYGQRVYITNQAGALFRILTDASTTRAYSWSPYGVPEFLFHNAGTLLKDTTTGTNQFDGLQVVNTALIDLQSGPINFNGGLDNQGEIRLGDGFNWTLTTDTVFRSGSQLAGSAGNVVLYQAGKMTFEPGFTFSPTLTNRVVGSCQFIGAISLPHFEMVNGAISGGFTNAGTMTWTNGNLSSATFVNATNGVLEVLGDADKLFIHSVLINAGTVNWQGGRLMAYANNYGQRVYITNQAGALFHVLTDASTTRAYSWSPYGVPEFLFHNAGTLLKETATGTNQFDGLQVVNTGLIDLQTGPINFNGGLINSGEIRLGNGLNLNLGGLDHSGAIHLGEGLTVLVTADSVFRPGSTLDGPAGNLVLYQGGKITFEPGFTFSPTLTNRVVGSCQFIGAINLPHFELISGAISGGFTNAGTLTWTNGNLSGATFVNATNGVLEVLGDADKLFIHSVLINAGTVNWQGGRLMAYANNYGQRVYITNQAGALFRILTDASTTRAYSWSPYGVPEFLFHNAGTLLKDTTTGTNQLDGLQVVNTALIDLQSGPINFNGGLDNQGEIRLGDGFNWTLTTDTVFRSGSQLAGSAGNVVLYQAGKMTFEPGFTFSPTLTNRVVGSCQFIGAISLPHFEMVNGAISGGFTNAGTMTWTNGNLSSATFVNATNGVLEVLGDADKLFIHSVLINAGTVNWQGGRLMAYANNYGQRVYITNQAGALFHVLTDASTTRAYSWSPYGVPEFLFHNAGTLLKDTTTGTNFLYGMKVVNDGHIVVNAGALSFDGGLENHGEVSGNAGLKAIGWVNGLFFLRLSSAGTNHYAIKASTNFKDWQTILTTNTTGGVLDFPDPQSPGFSQRYYQAIFIP